MKRFVKVTVEGKSMVVNLSAIRDIYEEGGKCILTIETASYLRAWVIDESFDEICEKLDEVLC